MKTTIQLLSILLLLSNYIFAQDYLPSKVDDHQIEEYTQYTLSYNEQHEQPDWVFYELTKSEVLNKRDRCKRCFDEDPRITTGSATLEDYRSSGFDRGHLSPSADNYLSDANNRESFLMSNMSPQLPSFNQGIWADLEEYVRKMAIQHEKVYVTTGPVFQNNLGAIGENKVTIPGYYYKVLLRFDDGKPKAIGFLLPHFGAVGEIRDYVVPVNTIETLTGIDFFTDLGSKENSIESKDDLGPWGLKKMK
ncbi:DNA/RNA non-specific endonuclease (plasmid) [Flammeovirga sp. MY04]|uniref:DNA/RNA non-specific endonuclease n=1 Tax=Flammeovirga sp. MY04 TaxID=1191459 RepID=UPI00080643E8|nr:DNA/RNA non-specific endonuclease [Flammeovirga sp. MY04]ANQ52899.1 DNA/RNA non-specific endonuclease [Flammeovirga sp. MY04]